MCVCSRMSQREREIKPTFLSFLKILQIKIKINFINGIVGELFMLMGMNKWRDRRGGAWPTKKYNTVLWRRKRIIFTKTTHNIHRRKEKRNTTDRNKYTIYSKNVVFGSFSILNIKSIIFSFFLNSCACWILNGKKDQTENQSRSNEEKERKWKKENGVIKRWLGGVEHIKSVKHKWEKDDDNR